VSYRCEILKEVKAFHDQHPGDFIVADTLPCFTSCPLHDRGKFATQMHSLLEENWLLGREGPKEGVESRIAVRFNPDKLKDFDSECRPNWVFWVSTAIAILGLLIALLAYVVPRK
jgi:hypothetical protein